MFFEHPKKHDFLNSFALLHTFSRTMVCNDAEIFTALYNWCINVAMSHMGAHEQFSGVEVKPLRLSVPYLPWTSDPFCLNVYFLSLYSLSIFKVKPCFLDGYLMPYMGFCAIGLNVKFSVSQMTVDRQSRGWSKI